MDASPDSHPFFGSLVFNTIGRHTDPSARQTAHTILGGTMKRPPGAQVTTTAETELEHASLLQYLGEVMTRAHLDSPQVRFQS
jgi:hypothetical protein